MYKRLQEDLSGMTIFIATGAFLVQIDNVDTQSPLFPSANTIENLSRRCQGRRGAGRSMQTTVHLVALRKYLEKVSPGDHSPLHRSTNVIRSFLSLPFFSPPKAILVPGMYFFGFSRYSNCDGSEFAWAPLEGFGNLPECPLTM